MIALQVESYCQDCPEFEPDVDKKTETYETWSPMEFVSRNYTLCETIVRCEHRDRCRSIKNRLEIELKKPKGEEK